MHGNLTHEGTSVTVELAQVFLTKIYADNELILNPSRTPNTHIITMPATETP